jgi:hypothetical protein
MELRLKRIQMIEIQQKMIFYKIPMDIFRYSENTLMTAGLEAKAIALKQNGPSHTMGQKRSTFW